MGDGWLLYSFRYNNSVIWFLRILWPQKLGIEESVPSSAEFLLFSAC